MKHIRYILIGLQWLLGWGLAVAQSDFTRFDWNVLRIDSVLPTYTEVVPLETDYRLFDYQVRVAYPEWAPLTPAETAVAERFGDLLADTLQVQTFVGISRGQGLLDISFVPVIRQEGRYMKLLSGKVEIIPVPKPQVYRVRANSTSNRKAQTRENRWAANSVLATGKWAKISVTEDGIYHLTNSQLASMGFTRKAKIRVYGYGGHKQAEAMNPDTDWDDLEEVALLPVSDGYLFLANGLVSWQGGIHTTNHYANAACYFVTEAEEDVSPITQETVTPADATPQQTVRAYAVYDPDEYAWFQGGTVLVERYDYANGNRRSYNLSLPALPAADSTATLRVCFTAGNSTYTEVTPTFNGAVLETMTIGALSSGYDAAVSNTRRYTVETPRQENTILFTATAGQHARLDYFELAYDAQLAIDQEHPSLLFTAQGAATFDIRYAEGQQPQLWQFPEPGQPARAWAGEERTDASGQRIFRVSVTGEGAADEQRYIVLDAAQAAAFPMPAIVGAVESQNLHALDSLDMVIITPASGLLDAQAQRMADIHEEIDGLRCRVVRADQIYNEFSSGTPDATAYRRFLKMLYDRGLEAGTAPRYLLLFGDCAWDNRMMSVAWTGYSPDNFLLCYESANSFSDTQTYVMEEYFGLLDDGEGVTLTREKADLGVGRFPVRTVKEATALVDKTIRYIRAEQAGAWKNVVCFMGDDGDNNQHLRMANAAADSVAARHPEMEVRKVIWDAYKRVSTATGNRYPDVELVLKKQMEEGALMMNYTGHAATYCISHEQSLRIEDFADFNTPKPPLWVTAACDVMPFDTQKSNIGETAVLHATGSAIAFYGTTRTVYASANEEMNQAFCANAFETDELGRPNRLGDAVRLAKVQVIDWAADSHSGHRSNSAYPVNKLHYALLGDPALRLGSITNHVILDSINGTHVSQLPEDYMIHAGSKVQLSGHVEDASQQPMDAFSGTLSVRLYDSQNTITCRNNDGEASELFTFTAYDKILYNGQDSIRAGHFSLTCPVPIDINYSNQSGRLLFYALSSDRLTEANGYCEDFAIGGTDPEVNDTIAPHILAYLDDESFRDGDIVGATPFFVATLQDESGICTGGSTIGHDLELVVDGKASTTYILNDYFVGEFGDYSRGTVAFSIPAMEKGEHTLLFRAWDMMGNTAATTLHCTVDPSLKVNILDLRLTNNPASSSTTFLLTHDRPGSQCDFTLEVFDFSGRLIWRHSETGASNTGLYTIPWNLTTGEGLAVGSGVYLYRARVSCDGSEEATATQKLIINRK
ncbi:MAG: type IX secretion system sortase PorU [Bacteroidaceae bacterium]|nr:type IX secretion system sortase PorU [Bacteroidaceae bacterium]